MDLMEREISFDPREQALVRLQVLYLEIEEARYKHHQLACAVEEAKEALKDYEMQLILSDAIQGKNAEVRDAVKRQLTAPHRAAVAQAEETKKLHDIRLETLQNELSSLRARSRFYVAPAE